MAITIFGVFQLKKHLNDLNLNIDDNMSSMDADKDGLISLAELDNLVEKNVKDGNLIFDRDSTFIITNPKVEKCKVCSQNTLFLFCRWIHYSDK